MTDITGKTTEANEAITIKITHRNVLVGLQQPSKIVPIYTEWQNL